LQDEVEILAEGEDFALLQSIADQLKFIFIVSRVKIANQPGDLTINIIPSVHQKCERCWHLTEDIGIDPQRPTICGRCVDNLNEGAQA